MFHSYFDRKIDKVSTLNIVHFTPSNKPHTSQFQNLISSGALIRGNTVRIRVFTEAASTGAL